MYFNKLQVFSILTGFVAVSCLVYIFNLPSGMTHAFPTYTQLFLFDKGANGPEEVVCGSLEDGHPTQCLGIRASNVRDHHVVQYLAYDEAMAKGVNNEASRALQEISPPRKNDEMRQVKKILIWVKRSPTKPRRLDCGFEQRCSVTRDQKEAKDADAVIINTREVDTLKDTESFPYHAHRKQILVFYNIEAPIRIKDLLKPYNDVFNLTMTYRLDSDIPVRYVTLWPRAVSDPYVPPTAADMAGKTQSIMWIISHCDKEGSHRWEYVQELSKYIDVEIFGACGKAECPSGGGGTNLCMTKAEQQYRFYLSLENSDCKDYVTEKLYKALARNVIPIVHGGLDYGHELPDKSVIRLIDFESPKHLADYLLFLSENDEEYLKYFEWKYIYKPNGIGGGKGSAFCLLCDILHNENYPYQTRMNVSKWWIKDADCTPMEEQARQLGLNITISR